MTVRSALRRDQQPHLQEAVISPRRSFQPGRGAPSWHAIAMCGRCVLAFPSRCLGYPAFMRRDPRAAPASESEVTLKRPLQAAPFVIGSIVMGAALLRPVRRWYLHWGATPDEVARAMPLDERVKHP